MAKIKTKKLVNKSKETLKDFIAEISNFENWWNKFNAHYTQTTQTITFSPIPFLKFQLKLINVTEDEIQFEYLNTPFKGTGTWCLNEQNLDQTLVSYSISITGNNFLIDRFINSKLFKFKHERDILNLLNKLNEI